MYNCCSIYNPPSSSSSGSGTGFTSVVTNYAALPSAASASGEFYYVENAQGTWWIPGSVGGTYYPPGTYYSTGSSWITGISPYQATLADVNTGTITDQFVSPSTFTNASKWTTKQDVLSGTGLVYSTAGTISYYTTTGSGTVAALQTSPTFITSIVTPIVYGGAAVGSTLDLIGTSANGTSTVSAINFKVGNNGATTALKIYNDATVNLGNATNTNQLILRVGQSTSFIDIGHWVGLTSRSAIYLNQSTPSNTNYALAGAGGFPTNLNAESGQDVRINVGGTTVSRTTNTGMYIGGSTANNSTLHVGGSFSSAYVSKTANYTATISDYTIDCISGTFTVTLPTAVGITGRIYVIKNSNAGTITVATTSSQTIDGVLTQTLGGTSSIWVQSNGSNWIILA